MIDIKLLRENPKLVKGNIAKKFQKEKLPLIDAILKNDEAWRKLKKQVDKLRADRNTISKQVAQAKKSKKETEAKKLLKEAKAIPEKIAKIEAKAAKLQKKRDKDLAEIPNFIHKDVPIGEDESKNKELKKIGKPFKFSFAPKNHIEIGEHLGQLDFDASASTSGNGFYYMQGDIALLNQALIRYATEFMVKRGYMYVETPLMLRENVINNVTDLHDKEMQIYKIQDQDLFLIGTSEHSLIGRFIDTIIPASKLPIKQASYSMCFRKEIGSHGIEEKGLYRTHQFNKIEMIAICEPEDSMRLFEEMKTITVDLFKSLKIPIRVLAMCSGDLGDLKHIQVDVEAWSPIKKGYYEVGSCSNLTDAQARKLKIRADGKGTRYTPHTLNNTAIATSRGIVAILENFQQKDGTVKIPDVLQPYMHGKKVIGKNN